MNINLRSVQNTGGPEWKKYEMTPNARHGSMLKISRSQFEKLVRAFPEKKAGAEGGALEVSNAGHYAEVFLFIAGADHGETWRR